MKILLVNGILTHGAGSVDLAGYELNRRGFQIIDVHQELRHPWDARNRNNLLHDALDIVALARDGDVLLCHSYGCLKGAMAMEHVDFRKVYMFRPAMSRRHKFAQPEKVTCWYSPADLPVWFGGMLWFKHPFGWAGTLGFKQPGVTNIRSHGGHSNDFHGANLMGCMDYIEADLA